MLGCKKMEIISFFLHLISLVPTGITVTQSGSVWVLGLDGNIYLFNLNVWSFRFILY